LKSAQTITAATATMPVSAASRTGAVIASVPVQMP
jgi:hypothetical protein